jgi:pyridoxal phosphate enzyme (YggS family)
MHRSLLVIPKLNKILTRMSSQLEQLPLIVNNAHIVRERINEVCRSNNNKDSETVHLVAVSKTKPSTDIQELYDANYRVFGENYTQELTEKAAQLPKDIKWHFIGHLQSSKAAKLVKDVPNLSVVETVDTVKLATKLNAACESVNRTLDVYIQVDTSGETTKSGVDGAELNELAQFIHNSCAHLNLKGLMTIGAPGDFACFDRLVDARLVVSTLLTVDASSLALSMGMSGDYEEAIRRGATSVRVGSTIFGERLYPKKISPN